MISQIVEVNKYFRNHYVYGALLTRIEFSEILASIRNSRWTNQLKYIETFIKNRPFMCLLCHGNIGSDMSALIKKDGVKR